MANLRDEILQLTNPTPVFKDLEDNSDDDTSAKVVDHDFEHYEEINQPSKLRQKTAIILADTDKKYAGKKTSRKNFNTELSNDSGEDSGDSDDVDDEYRLDDSVSMSDDNMDYDDDDEDHDSDDEGEDEEEEEAKMDVNKHGDKDFYKKITTDKFSFKDDGDYSKYADDENDDDEDESADDSGKGDEEMSDEEDFDDDNEELDSEDEGIQKFSSTAIDEAAKGQAAKHQLGLWDTLLEGRIKLQKAVSIVNQLPQKQAWSEFEQTSEMFDEEAGKAQQALGHLLSSLVHLQDLLLHQNTETRHILDGKTDNNKKSLDSYDDDEEIPSDTDDEIEKEEDTPTSSTIVKKRKLKFEEYPDVLKKRHCSFTDYRNSTIQKWYDKTRLATGKVKGKSFSAFDQSAVVQINQILADKERLVKRTQLKRTVYRVLGTQPKGDKPEILPPSQQEDETISKRDNDKDNDTEIFDDDDFYHQLLRELIEKKTSDVSDPVALSRQWLEIQKLRSKNKKAVDNRASKGRKVRYDVHKKLVNFMAPFDDCKWSHEARDDLFKSLFGKRFAGQQL